MKKVSIIGVGRLGGALAIALSEAGYLIENLIVRRKNENSAAEIDRRFGVTLKTWPEISQIESETVFIAVRDAEIRQVAEELAPLFNKKQPVIFHTSGALSSEILQDLKMIGCAVGSFHPLISISESRLGAERFKGAFFGLEGMEKAVMTGEKIAADLGGQSFSIATEKKTLYHAAAVTACGHLVSLIDVALEILSPCGLTAEDGQTILQPLIESTVKNLAVQTTSEALTGPFARADFDTFEKHLASFEGEISEEAKKIYLLLGERSVDLAEKQQTDQDKLKAIREKISLAKKNLKC